MDLKKIDRNPIEKRNNSNRDPPDLTSKNWKTFIEEYNIFSDSLWLIGSRDKSGGHQSLHHGGFIPQLPRQGILRFTKPYDLIIDGFLGYGTSLIECKRWGRNGIGVELSEKMSKLAKMRIDSEPNPYNVKTKIVVGDSTKENLRSQIKEIGVKNASLVILHPPYHDIIKYDDDQRNLCMAPDMKTFLKMFKEVVKKTTQPLKKKGYLQVVIGDKYFKGEWVPLAFNVMQTTMNEGFKLKSICIKNIEETIAKRHMINLWKYRTLMTGSHFFKHEYIFFFQK